MPPAESILVQRICEVRPGADPVKCEKAKVAGGRIAYVTCCQSERRISFK